MKRARTLLGLELGYGGGRQDLMNLLHGDLVVDAVEVSEELGASDDKVHVQRVVLRELLRAGEALGARPKPDLKMCVR
jgi:hypothetical protein